MYYFEFQPQLYVHLCLLLENLEITPLTGKHLETTAQVFLYNDDKYYNYSLRTKQIENYRQ